MPSVHPDTVKAYEGEPGLVKVLERELGPDWWEKPHETWDLVVRFAFERDLGKDDDGD